MAEGKSFACADGAGTIHVGAGWRGVSSGVCEEGEGWGDRETGRLRRLFLGECPDALPVFGDALYSEFFDAFNVAFGDAIQGVNF